MIMDNTGNMRLAVVAILRNTENKVLLIERNEPTSPHMHGKWHFPGGGIEFGEDPADAVLREVSEEVGDLSVQILSRRPIIASSVHEATQIHSIVLGYPVLYLGGTIDISKDESTADAKWYSISEVAKLDCTPEVTPFVAALTAI
jgi:mutator protein MutT